MYKKGWKYQDDAGDQGGGSGGADDGAAKGGEEDKTIEPKWQENWREMYAGEDKKKMDRLARYDSPAAAFDSLLSLQSKIGAGELRSALPKDATPEQVSQWRTENGIPEAPDKYDITFGDGGLPEADKPVISDFMSVMHETNANNAVVKKAVDWYYKVVEKQTEERQQKDVEFAAQAQDELRAEWGNDYKQNINMINGLVATAPADVADLIKGARLANGDPFMSSPGAMRWLANMAREINPVTTVIPNAGANIGSAIDDEIASIEKLMLTDRKAYNADEKKQARLRELYGARDRISKTR